MSNPLELVYGALWDLAESRPQLCELVKLGNRIRFDSERDRNPTKQEVSTLDLPELVLIGNGGFSNIHATSSSSELRRRYTWLLSTGDMRLQEYLYPVEWELFCAMCNWNSVLNKLTWQGLNFVKSVDFIDLTEGQSDPDRNRGIKGWSAVWTCEVTMYFSLKKLKE